MSEIQDRIADENFGTWLINQSVDDRDFVLEALATAEDLAKRKEDVGTVAIAAVLLDQWAHCQHMRAMADEVYNYAVGLAECHEYDVEQSPVPDTIEGLDE